MKVLVTGATGFIGANVVRALLARGDQVRCLVRKPNALVADLPVELLDTPLVPRDRADQAELVRAVDGCDGILHLAGVFDAGPEGRQRMRDVHVFGTRALCEAAVTAGVRRMVLCSSSVTVGFGSKQAPGDEDSPLDPDRVYGRTGPLRWYYDSKLQSERLASAWGGVEVVIVNPDFVVGPYDVKPTSGELILRMARGWQPLYPRGGKCFVDAGDCAMAHLAALDRGQPGRRYLLGNENLSYREFMTLVAEVIGRRPPLFPLPDVAVDLASGLGPWWARRSGKGEGEGFDPAVLRSVQQDRYRSGRRARDELSMPTTPLRSAVEKAWQWFRDNGYL